MVVAADIVRLEKHCDICGKVDGSGCGVCGEEVGRRLLWGFLGGDVAILVSIVMSVVRI